jgi:hypothetical protein
MNYYSGFWNGYTGKRERRALLTKRSLHHSWKRRVAAEAASFTLGNEQKLFASIPKTGLVATEILKRDDGSQFHQLFVSKMLLDAGKTYP